MPLSLGQHRELFVDDFLIASLTGDIRLHAHEPIPAEIALRLNKPWEGGFCNYGTVIRLPDRFLLYYRGWVCRNQHTPEKEAAVYCLAESEDGKRWTRPNLGRIAFKGSSANNIFLADSPTVHSFSPFFDARPDCPRSERFKAIGLMPEGKEKKVSALAAYGSSDGIRWRLLSKQPIICKDAETPHAFDSQNVAFWSESEGRYLCYFRTWSEGKRRISRAESQDFLHWTPRVQMEYRRFGQPVPVEEMYINQTHPYFRAPHIYVALAARFVKEKQVVTDEEVHGLQLVENYKNDCSDPVLLTTRGGEWYDRTFMESLIRPGPHPMFWTSRTNYPLLGVHQTGPTEMSLYLFEGYAQPAARVRRYVLRLDGFASVRASWHGGELLTKPFTFDGNTLLLNYACSAAGEVRVEITDESGTPLPGFSQPDTPPLYGNRIDVALPWKRETLAALAGRTVRLRFVMKDADLFSLQFVQMP